MMTPAWLLVPALFVSFWTAILGGISWLGGWSRLARVYPADRPDPALLTLTWQTAWVGSGFRYKGCLKVTAGRRGLGLSLVPIFSIFHAPVLIPWEDLEAQLQGPESRLGRMLVGRTVRLKARLAPEVPLMLPEALVSKLVAVSEEQWPAGQRLKGAGL